MNRMSKSNVNEKPLVLSQITKLPFTILLILSIIGFLIQKQFSRTLFTSFYERGFTW